MQIVAGLAKFSEEQAPEEAGEELQYNKDWTAAVNE